MDERMDANQLEGDFTFVLLNKDSGTTLQSAGLDHSDDICGCTGVEECWYFLYPDKCGTGYYPS